MTKEAEKACAERIGYNFLDLIHEIKVKKKGSRCQVWAPLISKVTKGVSAKGVFTIIKDRHPDTSINLKQVSNGKERGTDQQLDVIVAQTRITPKNAHDPRHSPEEEKCILKWYASLGEISSSTANRYRIPIQRPEIFQLYCDDGVKSILLSLLNEWPATWGTKAQILAKKREEEINKDSMDWGLRQMYQWKLSNYSGPCPKFTWKRSYEKFWAIVNMKQPGSRKKVIKSYYSIKLHPCSYCKEWEEEIEIYRDLKRAYEEEDKNNVQAKAELKKRLDLWAVKIKALERHKDKHDFQRRAVQVFAQVCKAFPGVCLVYEDFVNIYESDGNKMLNLMMVLVFWDADAPDGKGGKGAVREEYHDTFCRGSLALSDMGDVTLRGSADNCVYRDVWLNAFRKRPDLFQDRFHTFIKTGDNGSSLKSHETVYFHSVLMFEYHIRIIYWTLCPNHGQNYCDPAGARSEGAIKKYEVKTGEKSGNAEETARARNHYRGPNVPEARFTESVLEYNEYIPEEMVRRKQWFWAYSLGQCCVVFFQVTDIHENSKNPERTIEVGAAGMAAPTVKERFMQWDLRLETRDGKQLCEKCSKRFRRGIPRKEHNQKGYYLCPITNVYTRETALSLDRQCFHCQKQVRYAHRESEHTSDDDCPTAKLEREKAKAHEHESFSVISIDGRQRYKIHRDPTRKVTSADFPLEKLDTLASRFSKKTLAQKIFTPPKPGSFSAAKMMAPGLWVVYKLGFNEPGKLPWGIGVCENVKKDTFEVKVLQPSEPTLTLAPWGTWEMTDETKELSMVDSCWLKIRKYNRYQKLHTETLYKIRKDGRFGWEWVSQIDMSGPLPDPTQYDCKGDEEEKRQSDA